MSTLSKFLRFLLIGGTALALNLLVTSFLTEFLGLWYLAAYFIGTLISWTYVFFMNSLFTFSGHDKDRYAAKYGLFISIYIGTFAINAGIVYSLTRFVGVYYLLSIIIATAITTVITFSISSKFIFTYKEPNQ